MITSSKLALKTFRADNNNVVGANSSKADETVEISIKSKKHQKIVKN